LKIHDRTPKDPRTSRTKSLPKKPREKISKQPDPRGWAKKKPIKRLRSRKKSKIREQGIVQKPGVTRELRTRKNLISATPGRRASPELQGSASLKIR